MVERVLGALRTELGQRLGLIEQGRNDLLWVIDFPLFLPDEETGKWTFVHHPFTSPIDGHEDLIESDPALSKPISEASSAAVPGSGDWYVLIDGTDVDAVASLVATRFAAAECKPASVISSGAMPVADARLMQPRGQG